MPISLIVEDGSIVENANSYIDVSFADNYHLEHGNEEWLNLESEIEKYQRLIRAKNFIDHYFGRYFKGKKLNSEQDCEFPRKNIYINNVLLNNDKIPKILKMSQAEAAIHNELLFTAKELNNISSISDGQISISYESSKSDTTIIVDSVEMIINPLLDHTRKYMARVMR